MSFIFEISTEIISGTDLFNTQQAKQNKSGNHYVFYNLHSA